MKKFYKKLLSTDDSARKILTETGIGDWIFFKDATVRVDDANVEFCCRNCTFYADQRNNAKCGHYDCCVAHKRPDRHSVVFRDSRIINCRHELYVRSKEGEEKPKARKSRA